MRLKFVKEKTISCKHFIFMTKSYLTLSTIQQQRATGMKELQSGLFLP